MSGFTHIIQPGNWSADYRMASTKRGVRREVGWEEGGGGSRGWKERACQLISCKYDHFDVVVRAVDCAVSKTVGR